MNRRELIKMIAAATGTAFVGGSALLAGCTHSVIVKEYSFDTADIALLNEIAEIIIPRTDTPGAKDAKVGQLMSVVVNDCYTAEKQAIFHRGIAELRAVSLEVYSRSFMDLNPEQRYSLISRLDQEARLRNAGQEEDPHYFTLIKQLTLFGFFTSEVGATEVLRFLAIPGRYDGCIPYNEGNRAWAT